ncbi:MAG: 30S ribosomal protein S6 [Candidatus Omnitrophica bacterium]|nr:30S ribosomal protein S6 [Candidatus Omnitrophota bacterium]MBU1932981.1 30S ribosomal protein S6 [Candidatus Omnitrophota bacterium]
MNKYEAMFVLRPDLGKEELDKALSQIQDSITKNKGSVDEIKEWGRHKLAYLIEKHKEGIYYLANFQIDPEAVSTIKRAFTLNESILRSLVTRI